MFRRKCSKEKTPHPGKQCVQYMEVEDQKGRPVVSGLSSASQPHSRPKKIWASKLGKKYMVNDSNLEYYITIFTELFIYY